jgi:acyl-CoA oxidase
MYTEEWLDRMNKVLAIIENEPAFDKSGRYYQGRPDKISTGLWKDKRMAELAK